jgi:hypothetical protein
MLRKHWGKLTVVGVLLLGPPIAHVIVGATTQIEPPAVSIPDEKPVDKDGLRRVGPAWTRKRAGIREVYLEGTPEQLGSRQVRLNLEPMTVNEQELWDGFAKAVPFWPARVLVTDLTRLRYRHVDRGIPEARRRELAAQSKGFVPDPYAKHLPTYHRMVFLHAVYDIALSFEHSPLIGCTTFVLGPGATEDGHMLLARAFDFEGADFADKDKAIFFVREEGMIPFASVAWPGLVGVMSGMNAEGVAVVVHGGRAGEPQAEGIPVVFSLREVLSKARSTSEAVSILKDQRVMVSHIVTVADGKSAAIVERAPNQPAHVRDRFEDADRVGVTNHFEGPMQADPKNAKVIAATSTKPRRARIDALLKSVGPRQGSVEKAVAMLRDHTCDGDSACPLGDRRAIDALIATHGIVADTTDKVLWVSAGPHLSGKFVRYELARMLAADHDPTQDEPPRTLDEDPILFDGRYEIGRARVAGQDAKGGSR